MATYALTCENMPEEWVEVAGVEPASSEMLVGILRAQPVIRDLGSPPLTGGVSATPSPTVVSRRATEARPGGEPL